MADKPDVSKQDPAEGSREIVERELKRQGQSDGKGPKGWGQPASAGRAAKRSPPNETRH